jgi:Mg-chelatase subunit ChlD
MSVRCRPAMAPIAGLLGLVLLNVAGSDAARAQTSARPVAPRSKTKARASDAEIKVQSRDAAQKNLSKTAAELLLPPGRGRYEDGPIDWRDVPPWRQTTFFGIRAQGQFFIYVVDCSGSMLDDDRLVRAKRELRQSVNALQLPQRFQIIFYNDRPLPLLGDLPRSADQAAKGQMNHWLRLIEPDGETDPRGALAMALALRPDAVFLLSDGEFPPGTVESVAAKNRGKLTIPIQCIDLSGGEAGDQLSRIARDSGGQYAERPPRPDEVSP